MTKEESNLLIAIHRELATNTHATQKIEEHLRTLNGKVLDHERRLEKVGNETETLKRSHDSFVKFRDGILSKLLWALLCFVGVCIVSVGIFLIRTGTLASIINQSI